MSTRCTRDGEGEKGRISWMMVWLEREGERRKLPFGETESDVGVSVCPMREGSGVDGERMSRTYPRGRIYPVQ